MDERRLQNEALGARSFRHRHLLGIDALDGGDIGKVLGLARHFHGLYGRPEKKLGSLRGKTVVNLFLEASTRTRTSFELAAKRLGADAVNISGSTSSATKGESLLDTVLNVDAMGPDVIVLRHSASGAAAWVAKHTRAAVVNAGDGTHEHPSQALLDAATILEHRGAIAGLEVAICGDVLHSRVARSNILCLTRLGANVRLVGPESLVPRDLAQVAGEHAARVRVCHRLEEGLEGADVVMMLRVQAERLQGKNFFATTREFSRTFGLSPRSLAFAKPDAIVMHPGPMNRGVEIDPAVADGSRSVILSQVAHGVSVRMAILHLLAASDDAAPVV